LAGSFDAGFSVCHFNHLRKGLKTKNKILEKFLTLAHQSLTKIHTLKNPTISTQMRKSKQ